MKKYLSSVLIMLCILLSAVVASAEKAEWKADNYDLSKVQKIYTQYFSAKFVLTDKDGKTIFERIDKREDEKKAYDMFNRAAKDFYKDVNSLK